MSLWSQQIKSKLGGTSKCLSAKKASIALLGSQLLVPCPGTAFRPNKREVWPAAWAATATVTPCCPVRVCHCWKLDFYCGSPRPAVHCPQGSPSGPACGTDQVTLWRRLTLWATAPPRGLPLTSLGLTSVLSPFSPWRPSPLRFLSPLKFHAQCHSGASLRDQHPYLLFFVSRISPGLRLLSFVTLHYTGLVPLSSKAEGLWWGPELWQCMQDLFSSLLEIKNPSPACWSFLPDRRDQFKFPSWLWSLTT